MILRGRKVVGGSAKGEALVSSDPVSFYGGVDPETGSIIEQGHAAFGKRVSGKVFVFPTGKGSTVGSYVIYRMKKLGTAPIAIINVETEAIIATGCVLASIPLIDRIKYESLSELNNGDIVYVNGDQGYIDVVNS